MNGIDQFAFRYYPDKDIEELILIAYDKNVDQTERINVLLDLSRTAFDIAVAEKDEAGATELALRMLLLFNDKTEDPSLRGHVADQFSHHWDERAVQSLFEGLQDEAVEVRFWSAFGTYILYQRVPIDLAPMRQVLDQLVAADDVLPGMWSAGREALPLLEAIDFEVMRAANNNLPKDYETALLSPLPEYHRFLDATMQHGRTYTPLVTEGIYQMTPEVLSARLRRLRRRALLQLNVRPPLHSYTLDWRIGEADTLLMGALHRDGFGVVLTGSRRMIARFAARYRAMLPRDVPLYLYAWFGDGYLIKPRTRPREIVGGRW